MLSVWLRHHILWMVLKRGFEHSNFPVVSTSLYTASATRFSGFSSPGQFEISTSLKTNHVNRAAYDSGPPPFSVYELSPTGDSQMYLMSIRRPASPTTFLRCSHPEISSPKSTLYLPSPSASMFT